MSAWAILFVAASYAMFVYASALLLVDSELRTKLLDRVPSDAAKASPAATAPDEWDVPLAEYADRVNALSGLLRELSRSGLAAMALGLAALFLSVPATLLLVDEARDSSAAAIPATGGSRLATYYEYANAAPAPRDASEAGDELSIRPRAAKCVAEIAVPLGARLRIGVAAPLWRRPGGWLPPSTNPCEA